MIELDGMGMLTDMLAAGWVLRRLEWRNNECTATAHNGNLPANKTIGATGTDIVDCVTNLYSAWRMREYQDCPERLDLCAVCHERVAGHKDERRQVGPVWVCHQCYEDIDVNSR